MASKISPVDKVIAAFGGASAFAGKLGVATSTVQKWQRRKAFPAARHEEIQSLAERDGIDVTFLAGEEPRITPRIGNAQEPEGFPSSRLSDAEPVSVPAAPEGKASAPRSPANPGTRRFRIQQGCMWGIAGGVFLLAILTAGSQFGGMRVRDSRVDSMDSQMAVMRQQLEAATHAGANTRRDFQRLESRMAALEARMEGFLSSPPESEHVTGLAGTVSAVQADVARLAGRLDDMRKGNQASEALALALGQLRMAAQGSGSFRDDLDAVRLLALQIPADAAGERDRLLNTLRGLSFHAEHGIKTVAELRDGFAVIAGQVVAAARAPMQGGAAGRALRWMMSSVRIHHVPAEMSGNSADAVVARIQARLQRGDLAAAVSEVLRLNPDAATLVAPWLAQAQARLTVDHTLATLSRSALIRLVPEAGAEDLAPVEPVPATAGEAPVVVVPAPEPVPAAEGETP